MEFLCASQELQALANTPLAIPLPGAVLQFAFLLCCPTNSSSNACCSLASHLHNQPLKPQQFNSRFATTFPKNAVEAPQLLRSVESKDHA